MCLLKYRYPYIYLIRVLDIEQGIERLVSGGLHATSRDVSAESQVLLWPLEFKGQIRRRLSDWCTFVPTLSIACKIESIKVSMCFLIENFCPQI